MSKKVVSPNGNTTDPDVFLILKSDGSRLQANQSSLAMPFASPTELQQVSRLRFARIEVSDNENSSHLEFRSGARIDSVGCRDAMHIQISPDSEESEQNTHSRSVDSHRHIERGSFDLGYEVCDKTDDSDTIFSHCMICMECIFDAILMECGHRYL